MTIETTTIQIKNMVCDRCIKVVNDVLKALGANVVSVNLGNATFVSNKSISVESIENSLYKNGFQILLSNEEKMVEKIKNAITQLIYQNKTNNANFSLSTYITDITAKSYNQVIFPSSLQAQIIDSDGKPLPTSINSDTLVLMPGERYGVMLTPTSQITDSIIVHYKSMNTDSTYGTEYPPVVISGFFAVQEDESKFKISVYPNPNNGTFTITGVQNANVEITNTLGEVVLKREIKTISPVQLDISKYPKGTYFIKVINSKGVFTTRIISI